MKPVMEEQKNELQPSFQSVATPIQRVTVTLDLDADVLDWFRAQPTDWRQELNNLARFYMDTSQSREDAFAEASGSQGDLKTGGPRPARNPSKRDLDFTPS